MFSIPCLPSIWLGALALGLAFGALAVGVYITFRVLQFPDLTIDGSFPLGAALAAPLIVKQGWNPWTTLPLAAAAGALAGLTTGILTTRCRINGILAGILVSLGLFSINLRLMSSSNLSLLGTVDLFAAFKGLPIEANTLAILVFAGLIATLLLAINYFLITDLGLTLRAAGNNATMVRAQGFNPNTGLLIGLAVANALAALSGALVMEYQGFADVNMGLGTILAGLAAVIIGEVLIPWPSVVFATLGTVVGMIVYRAAIATAINDWHVQFCAVDFRVPLLPAVNAGDTRLATAVIVAIALMVPQIRGRLLRGGGRA